MARPRQKHPTQTELEVLKVLWAHGELTVRGVLEALDPRSRRAYTSVMSLLNVMTEKGLLVRRPQGRAFLYAARTGKDRVIRSMLGDLMGRAFDGSPATVVAHLLEQTRPSSDELDSIHDIIQRYRQQSVRPS